MILRKRQGSPVSLRSGWFIIQKIYEVDPLICPKCQGKMRVIAFIEDDQIIKKILDHLDLWETNNHDPPPQKPSYIPEITYDNDYLQVISKKFFWASGLSNGLKRPKYTFHGPETRNTTHGSPGNRLLLICGFLSAIT